MSQLLGGIPRAERELGAVEAEIAALAHDFENVAKQASQLDDLPSDSADGKVQEDEAAKSRAETVSPSHARATAAYIEDLETLDRMKRNMEDTKTLLHEAAAWERLVRETDIVFEASDLGRVADHISMLQRSAAALADLPESGKRSEVLYSVNSRFEELVLPQLTAALASDNNDSLQRLVLVFTRMGQLKFVCTSFAKARVAPLLDLWRESFDDANFVEWMGAWSSAAPPPLPPNRCYVRAHRRLLSGLLPDPYPGTQARPSTVPREACILCDIHNAV